MIAEYFKKAIMDKNAASLLQDMIDNQELQSAMPNCLPVRNKREADELYVIINGMNKCRVDLNIRLAVFFSIFGKERSASDICFLSLDEEKEQKIVKSIGQLEDLSLVSSPVELKKYIYMHGYEFYEFADAVSKQMVKIFNQPEFRTLSRKYVYECIQKNKEPVLLEDLLITPLDLIESGVNQQDIPHVLERLILLVHRNPMLNDKSQLLLQSQNFSRGKIRSFFKSVPWIK